MGCRKAMHPPHRATQPPPTHLHVEQPVRAAAGVHTEGLLAHVRGRGRERGGGAPASGRHRLRLLLGLLALAWRDRRLVHQRPQVLTVQARVTQGFQHEDPGQGGGGSGGAGAHRTGLSA